MDASKIKAFVDAKWDSEIVPQLVEYIRIPNKSPMFDADWVKNGHMDRAFAQASISATARSMWPFCTQSASNIGDLLGMRMYSTSWGTISLSHLASTKALILLASMVLRPCWRKRNSTARA